MDRNRTKRASRETGTIDRNRARPIARRSSAGRWLPVVRRSPIGIEDGGMP
jgi:hypothetical protein